MSPYHNGMIDNEAYWETRKQPGEEIANAGFIMSEGFEKYVTFGMTLMRKYREAIETERSFRFELRWDPKAHRTFYCFFDSTECVEDVKPRDPDPNQYRRKEKIHERNKDTCKELPEGTD